MKTDVLKRPFEPDEIKTRKAGGGRSLRYADGATYVRRLNEAFDHAWQWTILARDRCPEVDSDGKPCADELVVLGRLEAGGVVHEAFGGATVGRGENLGDDWKAAATDALKKAASLFGIGLELYTDVRPRDEEDEAKPPAKQASKPSPSQRLAAVMARVSENAKALGWTADVLDQKCLETYNVASAGLTLEQAEQLGRRLAATIAKKAT
jgi:hypothetical protein